MKTVRTVRKVYENEEDISQEPKFQIGDYVEIVCGEYEDHGFWIRNIRFNHDIHSFEYLYSGILRGEWAAEDRLNLIGRAKAA